MFLSFYCKGSKRECGVLLWEGAGDWTELKYFDLLLLWSTLCLSRSLMLNRRSWGPLCWVLAFFTASYQHLLWTPTHQGLKAPSAWCGFPYHISSITPTVCNSNSTATWPPSWLRYIIVQHPLDRWNRMFNRHQAEITVMQFTGHSLPVHQSMSVPWEFFSSSHFISQFLPMRFPLITAIGMCHLLPVHHLGMAFLAGSKGQNITMQPNNPTLESHVSRRLGCWQKDLNQTIQIKAWLCLFHIWSSQKVLPPRTWYHPPPETLYHLRNLYNLYNRKFMHRN